MRHDAEEARTGARASRVTLGAVGFIGHVPVAEFVGLLLGAVSLGMLLVRTLTDDDSRHTRSRL